MKNDDFSRKSDVNIYGLEQKIILETAENQCKFIKEFALIWAIFIAQIKAISLMIFRFAPIKYLNFN